MSNSQSYHYKLSLIENEQDINVFDFENCLSSCASSLQKSRASVAVKTIELNNLQA